MIGSHEIHRTRIWRARAFGGNPHYLNLTQPGHSAAQSIDAQCFRPEACFAMNTVTKPIDKDSLIAVCSQWGGLLNADQV